MSNPDKDIRWRQRFENFEKAYKLLYSVMDRDLDNLADIEKEGYIQRLEMTFELAWKVMKDYLEFEGVKIDLASPRTVIREAFAIEIIKDGHIWMNMLEDRNLMSHTYNEENFKIVISKLKTEYIPSIEQLYNYLKEKSQSA